MEKVDASFKMALEEKLFLPHDTLTRYAEQYHKVARTMQPLPFPTLTTFALYPKHAQGFGVPAQLGD